MVVALKVQKVVSVLGSVVYDVLTAKIVLTRWAVAILMNVLTATMLLRDVFQVSSTATSVLIVWVVLAGKKEQSTDLLSESAMRDWTRLSWFQGGSKRANNRN